MFTTIKKLLTWVGNLLLTPLHFSRRQKLLFGFLIGGLIAEVILLAGLYLQHHSLPVLNPQGSIGLQQRNLIYFGTLLSLIVVIPVFAMTFWIVWKYRETNKRPKDYKPDWDRSVVAESIWWGVPILLILVLSVVTWQTSHSLDPSRPIASSKPPLVIQVVALQWRWLFIYPEQDIATINYVQMPVDQPVEFQITADAPMNSFWIPALGGQIYAMSAMTTKLHLEANHVGTFNGVSANISGDHFADMTFKVDASDKKDFDTWVAGVRQDPDQLDTSSYADIATPSSDTAVAYYGGVQDNIYSSIVNRYADHNGSAHEHAEGLNN